jgi:hypothetical protein
MTGFPGGAAIIGLGGARIVRSDGTVQPRATGVRGIEDAVVIASQNLMVLSTLSNLLSFPLEAGSEGGQVIDERGGGSMQLFQDDLAVADPDSLRLLRVQRQAGDVSARTLTAVVGPGFITDIAFGERQRIGWALMEDRLIAFSPDLKELGEYVLPAAGQSVRAEGNRLTVAAGAEGVFILDAEDPAAPRVVIEYTGVRFAYAAELDGDLLYVAAGPEGVAVVDVSGEVPRVVGVAREVGFASDVVVGAAGEVWILDRNGQSVQIADLGSRSTGNGSGNDR